MKAQFLLLLVIANCIFANAQSTSQTIPEKEPFGKIDHSELELTDCDFEKGANAMVLFNYGNLYWGEDLKSIINQVHKRIKIFTDQGKDYGNVKIEYEGGDKLENITGLEAETVNLVDGKPEVTKLEKKSIFNTVIDNVNNEITFSMPNVKIGSVIDIKYTWTARYNAFIPTWEFQQDIPVKYCELSAAIPDIFYFREGPHINHPLAKHTSVMTAQVFKAVQFDRAMGHGTETETETIPYDNDNQVWGLSNIPSLREEAFSRSFDDNVDRLSLDLVSMKPLHGFNQIFSNTWAKVGGELQESQYFGSQLNRSLPDEELILEKAKTLKTDDEKFSYIFKEVRNAMKWNNVDNWSTNIGTVRSWTNKTGNSTEINLILYHLLKKSGLTVYPMVVSTQKNGKVDPYTTSLSQFNRTVVLAPIDSNHHYIMDATGKYNLYNTTPADLLNSMGLFIDKSTKTYDTLHIENDEVVRKVVVINAELQPGGVLKGTAQINSFGNEKTAQLVKYNKEGEKIYNEYLTNSENTFQVTSLKSTNEDDDNLPLVQEIEFKKDLNNGDENYIYLNPDIFTTFNANPFLSENRSTDIYFGYKRNYSINLSVKLPPGYTVIAPQSVSMQLPDKNIGFKRVVAQQDGNIIVNFTINIKQPAFSKELYPAIRQFYKKMFEMLNEPVVLKKI